MCILPSGTACMKCMSHDTQVSPAPQSKPQGVETGYTAKSPPSASGAVSAPKPTAQKESVASILSSLTASTSATVAVPGSQQRHTTSSVVSKKPTPPPSSDTPPSPKPDLGSPKEAEAEGPPKRVPIPSANKSFQLFKKQALEKSERVGVV